MRKGMKTLLVLLIVLALSNLGSALAFDYGEIPTSALPPNGWSNTTWSDPGEWITIDVTEYGLPANDSTVDATEKIRDIISSTSGNRILYFPEGTYNLKTRLEIGTSNIILKGDGADKSEILIDTLAEENGTIMFCPNVDYDATIGTTISVITAPVLGDQTITVEDASTLNVGDVIYLYLQGGLEHWGKYTEAQILTIEEINGNTLTVDMKLGLDFPDEKVPVIQKLDVIKNVGVRDLKVHRTRAAIADSPSNIEFNLVYNGFVSDVESSYSERAHIITRFSKNIIVERNYIHHSYSYGGGGQGYGIEFSSASTSCRATDNKLWTLRHHLMAHLGANHNVFSYNSLEADYNGTSNPANLHGDYAHNNLFESNYFQKNGVSDGYWGADGPRNTWFRNYSGGAIGTYDARYGSDTIKQVIIGNIMNQLVIDNNTDYIAVNKVGDTIQWGELSSEASVPASLYLPTKPTFLGEKIWPLYGPGVTDWGIANTLPSKDRNKIPGYVVVNPEPGVILVDDNFDSETTGITPTSWTVDENYGTVDVVELSSSTDKSMKLTDTSSAGGPSASQVFQAQSGKVSLEYDIMLPVSVDYFNVQLKEDSTGTSAVSIFTRGGNLTYKTGSGSYVTLQAYNINTWYNIKIVADVSTDKCDIYVNNIMKATQVDFRNETSTIDSIFVGSPGSNTGTVYVDNIKVYIQ